MRFFFLAAPQRSPADGPDRARWRLPGRATACRLRARDGVRRCLGSGAVDRGNPGRGRVMAVTESEESRQAGEGRRGRRSGGAEARRARRQGGGAVQLPYIRRKLARYEVLDEEGLALIEANADLILEEIGIEFREDEEALALWRNAGADVNGTRVRFPRG